MPQKSYNSLRSNENLSVQVIAVMQVFKLAFLVATSSFEIDCFMISSYGSPRTFVNAKMIHTDFFSQNNWNDYPVFSKLHFV